MVVEGQPTRRRRVVASEVLLVTGAVGNLIATGKSAQIYSAMESGGGSGMQTQEECLAKLWAAGRISEATATAAARNPGNRAGSIRPIAQRPQHTPRGNGGGK